LTIQQFFVRCDAFMAVHLRNGQGLEEVKSESGNWNAAAPVVGRSIS
jgi:hypothetical protein